MRVLHLINGESFAGAERVQDLLAMRLPEFGFDVSFVCLKPRDFAARRHSHCPLHEVPMGSRFDFTPAFNIARRVRAEGHALIHTHTPRAVLIGRLAAGIAHVPMVHHVHSPTSRDTESAVRNRLNAVIERFSMAGAARLIPVSSSLAGYLAAHGHRSPQVRQVANGVPTPGPLRRRPTPSTEWIIGSMALFRPRKGLEVLLDAVALLRARGQPVRLRLVGPFETADYESAMRSRASTAGLDGVIDWLGFRRDVHQELAQMDAFVLPSLFGEGMPMVVLEAMGAGVPVIASAVEGIPEVIDDGRTGLLVKPGDTDELARALQSLLDGRHDWQAIRAAAWCSQSSRFSDRAMAEGVAQVYRELIGA